MATWPSSSDPSNQQPDAIRKRKKSDQVKFLIPLIYAPVLPLIRITLRKQPVLRDRLFIAVLAGAFAHGTYLVYPFVEISNFVVIVILGDILLRNYYAWLRMRKY